MRLLGKQVLMVVGDGVQEEEVEQLREAFQREEAMVLITSPQEYMSVETVKDGHRGKDLQIDIPFEAIDQLPFDGLIIPDGLLSTDMLSKDKRVVDLVRYFHQHNIPIFASGRAVRLLYESQVLWDHIVVRDGTPLTAFMDKAIGVLLDCKLPSQLYRATT